MESKTSSFFVYSEEDIYEKNKEKCNKKSYRNMATNFQWTFIPDFIYRKPKYCRKYYSYGWCNMYCFIHSFANFQRRGTVKSKGKMWQQENNLLAQIKKYL